MSISYINKSLHDEPYCGDQGKVWQHDNKIILCLADGLGHGYDAERAARTALDYIGEHLNIPLPALIADCNHAMRKTRGAALIITVIDPVKEKLSYVSVNNIRGVIHGSHQRSLAAIPGFVGGSMTSFWIETVPFDADDLLILATDGIQQYFTLKAYHEEIIADPQRLAEQLLADWALGTDDAGVLIYRH
jgi:negative regulator of sigma-B (phosphoserine phosphatase)